MDIEIIKEFIDPQLIIIVPMLWGIGMALKQSRIENRFIPVLLLICSCAVVILHLFSRNPLTDFQLAAACLFAGITQGSVIWLTAWLGYEQFLHNKGDT